MRKTFIYDVAKITVNSSAPVKVVCQIVRLSEEPFNSTEKVGGGGGEGREQEFEQTKVLIFKYPAWQGVGILKL